jgi:hypothetical protein
VALTLGLNALVLVCNLHVFATCCAAILHKFPVMTRVFLLVLRAELLS